MTLELMLYHRYGLLLSSETSFFLLRPSGSELFPHYQTKPLCERRRGGTAMPRSVWKGPYVAVSLLQDVIAFARRHPSWWSQGRFQGVKAPEIINTHCRSSVVLPDFLNCKFGVRPRHAVIHHWAVATTPWSVLPSALHVPFPPSISPSLSPRFTTEKTMYKWRSRSP